MQPNNAQEIIDLVNSGRKIRCVGTGHSWSNLIPSDDVLVNTDSLNRIIGLDSASSTATIQAGAKLEKLNPELWDRGFAFKNLGSIARQSLAGAVSTGTHGTGINHQLLASMVRSFKMVTGNGKEIELDRERDRERFHLALVSMGMLGIITEMTIDIIPKFNLHERSGAMDFDEVCDNILDWLNEHDHIKMWWFPHTNRMMVYRYGKTDDPVNDTWFRQKLMDEWVSVYFYRMMLWWGNHKPSRRAYINDKILTKFIPNVDRIERSYKVFNVPEPPIHRETEWAFDINLTPAVLREYRKMVEQRGHYINFIQEIRFVKGDQHALSPCYGRDSVYVGCYNADNKGWSELLSDFEERIGKPYEGRPHWGKEFNVGSDYLKSSYPKWDEFQQLRSELDPKSQFQNSMLKGLFSR